MGDLIYRPPTDLERAFLNVVTRGFPSLTGQIQHCEIADYDPTGWCHVRIAGGKAWLTPNPIEGPAIKTGDPNYSFIEILLWTNDAGMLETVEIVSYGPRFLTDDPYQLFVEAANSGRLEYRFEKHLGQR